MEKPDIKKDFRKDVSLYWYNFYILSSLLQKSIRRWDTNGALFATKELIESWFVNYVWKRLIVISVEDIWKANIYMSKLILELYKFHLLSVTDNSFDETFVYSATFAFCKSEKSRENDNFICCHKDNNWNFEHSSNSIKEKLDVNYKEDRYFLEKYYKEEFWNKNSKKTRLEIENMIDDDYKSYIPCEIYDVYKELLFIWKDLNIWDWLILFFINFHLLKRNKIEYDCNYFYNNEVDLLKNMRIKGDIFNIPDYVYDKHTVQWKLKERSIIHFLTEWSYLKNESIIDDNYYKKLINTYIEIWLIKD